MKSQKPFFLSFAFSALALPSLSRADNLPTKVTYDEHVRPIFKEHCLSCHNSGERKSGLVLDTYAGTMEGGSGGESLVAGDLESSRLYALTAHLEEPKMPPSSDRIADGKIAVLKRWIEQGMPENNGSKVMAPKVDLSQMGTVSLTRPEGPLPMPESVFRQTPLFTERAASIAALAASPWSPLIAVGGQEQVSLYHSQTGELLGILPFPEGEPQSITFSRDGKLILVGGGRHSAEGFAVLYDIKTGNRITRVGDELDIVMAADISDDNAKIALAGPQKLVRIYDTATAEKIFELKKHTDWIYSLRFSPDGVLIASADRSNGLMVWEADTGKLYLDLIGHKGEVRSLAWRPDSLALVSASLDGTLKLWDVNAGKLINSWDAHVGGAVAVASCNDGTLVSTGQDKKVKLWKANGDTAGEMPALPDAGLEVAITADGKEIAAGDWSGNVKLWERANPKNERNLRSNPKMLERIKQEAETQLADIKITVDEAQSAFDALAKQHTDAVAKQHPYIAAVEASNQAMAAAKSELEGLKKQAQAASSAAQSSVAEIEKQRTALQQTSNQLAILKSQGKEDETLNTSIEEANKNIDVLEALLKNQRVVLVEKNSFVAAMEAKLAKLTVEQSELVNGRDALQPAINDLTKKLAEAKVRFAAAQASLTAQAKKVEVAQAEITRFVQAKKNWETRTLAIAEQTKSIEQVTAKIQGDLDSQAKSEAKAQAKIDALKQQLEQMQKSIQDAEQEKEGFAKSLAEKKAELDKQLSQLGLLQNELTGLRLQLDCYKN
jgi:WD40 repeat protein/mono/diheme cytochrome c family protein